MDIDRFRALLDDPEKSKQDLLAMRENALRVSALEHVRAAEQALDLRFPSWRTIRSRRGGSKPTDVEFQGKTMHFESEKEAYIWLIERFIQHYSKPFVELNWETVFVAKGPRALYFAKSLRRLFGNRQHLAEDSNKYHRLTNGWYAKLVLSELQKLSLLIKFATVAQLKFGTNWDWNSRGRSAPFLSADDLLRELEDEISGKGGLQER